ncbi:MAG: putative LPS assembly protein LptD [bacterium]
MKILFDVSNLRRAICIGFPLIFILLLGDPLVGEEPTPEGFDISAEKLFGTSSGMVFLHGNVKIVHGGAVATADTGMYNQSAEIVELIGNVTIEDRNVRSSGPKARYELKRRVATFSEGVDIEDGKATISAEWGRYDLSEDVVYFRGHVRYQGEARSLLADSVRYDRRSGLVEAIGGVVLSDEARGAVLRASSVLYFTEIKQGIAIGQPMLEISRQGASTLVVSDSLKYFSEERRTTAIGNVRIIQDSTYASSARAILIDEENVVVLSGNPLISDGRSSLSGETISIFSKDDRLDNIIATGNATSVYAPRDQKKTVLTGDQISLDYDDGKLSIVEVKGRSRATFNQDVKQSAADDQVLAELIQVFVKDGKVDRARIVGDVTGVYRLEAEGGELVNYFSDSLLYDVPNSKMVLMGKASVKYGNMRLVSSTIEYNSSSGDLYAPKDPILWEGDERIAGSQLVYNLRTARGVITAGRTAYERGIYYGDVIRKTGGRALNVENGTYSSCDLLDPHYTFTSQRMKIYTNDKVITKPLVLRVRDVPIFALPFFIFPIRSGRHSGILIPSVEFGFDQDKGRFIRNAGYYWAPNDYFDLTVWADYYEQTRWIGHCETRYAKRYSFTGSFKGSYSKDLVTNNKRWDAGGTHDQKVGDNGRIVAHADFVSDKTYRRQVSDDLEEQLRRELESDLAYSYSSGGRSFNIAVERRQNLDTDETSQTLPRLSLAFSKVTLKSPSGEQGWHRGTYLTASSSFLNSTRETGLKKRSEQSGRVDIGIDSNLLLYGKNQSFRNAMLFSSVRKGMEFWCSGCQGGRETNSALSYQSRFVAQFLPFGWLNFDPSASASLVVFDEDRQGRKYPLCYTYGAGFSSTASFFRTFFVKVGPLRALRHVVTPRIGYTYRPDFSKWKGRFYSLPGVSIDASEAQLITMSLSNRMQAKIDKDGMTKKIDNLFTLETSTTCDLLYKKKNQKTPFSTIYNSLRIYPYANTSLDLSFSNDPADFSFKSFDMTLGFNFSGSTPQLPGFKESETAPEERFAEAEYLTPGSPSPCERPWQIGTILRYSKDYSAGQDRYWLDLTMGLSPTRKWRVEYGGRFDLSNRQTTYQEYSIYRDLHCWEAQFVRRYSGGNWQYYFRINIKAHPEIYTERGLRALYRRY